MGSGNLLAIEFRIDDACKNAKLTQEELAARLGITTVALLRLIRGKNRAINLKYLDLLCLNLECSVSDLLEHVPSTSPDGS